MKSLHFFLIFDPIVDLEFFEVVWKRYHRFALGVESTDLGCDALEFMLLTHVYAIH